MSISIKRYDGEKKKISCRKMFWRGNFKLFIDIAVGGEKGEGGGVGSIRNILKTLLYFEFKFIYTV